MPTDYFSPKRFNGVELFLEILNDEKIVKAKSWFYKTNLSTGFIFIADNSKQWTYRVQAKFGYKLSDRLLVNVYGTQSTIAYATAAEFTFNEIGLRLKWNLFDKLIFDLKTHCQTELNQKDTV